MPSGSSSKGKRGSKVDSQYAMNRFLEYDNNHERFTASAASTHIKSHPGGKQRRADPSKEYRGLGGTPGNAGGIENNEQKGTWGKAAGKVESPPRSNLPNAKSRQTAHHSSPVLPSQIYQYDQDAKAGTAEKGQVVSKDGEEEEGEEEEENDNRTIFTDNHTLDIRENVKKLISAFSGDLIRRVQEPLGDRNHKSIMRNALGDFLKEFSIKLQRTANTTQKKDATTFIRRYRRRIARSIETAINNASRSHKEDSEYELEEEYEKKQDILKTQKRLSVNEKMKLRDTEQLRMSKMEDGNLDQFDANDNDWNEEHVTTYYEDALSFLTNGHAYQWLLGQIGTEMLLTKRHGTLAESIRDKILKGVTTDKTRIILKLRHSIVFATVQGTGPAIAEIGQQLSWLGAALRSSSCDYAMACSTPKISFWKGGTSFRLSFEITDIETFHRGTRPNGCCWHPLFGSPVIVKGYPILARFNDEKGLEINLSMMAGLGQASRITNFDGGLIIKGFSTMFCPTSKIQDSVLWHYLFNDNTFDDDGGRISYLSAHSLGDGRALIQDVDTSCLEHSRNFLGWASSVEVLAGTEHYRYNEIDWAGSGLASAGLAFEKASIVAGNIVTGGASFTKGNKDTPIYLNRGGPYAQEIHFAHNMKVVLYDKSDRRGWLVDGASALLHITRTQLSSSPYSESELFKIEDFQHAGPSPGVSAARQALMNPKNRELLIFEDVEISTEYKTTISGAVEEQARKTTKRWTYQDLVRQTYHVLEQIHDYQTMMAASPGFGIRGTDREKLLGFGFMDIVDGQNALLPRVVTLKQSGRGWVDFTKGIRAIILFGKGFGEIIRPARDSNKLCKYWSHVPTGKDYLVASIATLKEICIKNGDLDSDPMELANGIYWHKPDKLFEPCDCKHTNWKRACDRVQVLLPPSLGSKKHPQPFCYPRGAVIFGRSTKFPWRWPRKGDPVEGASSDLEPDDETNFRDSGIGESNPSATEADSSGSLDSPPSSTSA